MIKTMPCAPLIMVVVLVTMVAFYATSFDSIALTASCYSYRKLEDGEEPAKGSRITMPIGNAATILTDCRLFMELSAKRSAIGSRISRIHHIS